MGAVREQTDRGAAARGATSSTVDPDGGITTIGILDVGPRDRPSR
jgi:hypothetical protein